MVLFYYLDVTCIALKDKISYHKKWFRADLASNFLKMNCTGLLWLRQSIKRVAHKWLLATLSNVINKFGSGLIWLITSLKEWLIKMGH